MSLKLLFIHLIFSIFSLSFATDIFKPTYTFKDVSVNHLDWTLKTENESPQKDFTYAELETGAGFNWGEAYMFLDIENPTDKYNDTPPHSLRIAFKPVLDINFGKSNWAFHSQDYSLTSDSFFVNNFVNGVSYKYAIKNFWIRPFVGIHYQNSTYYSGWNGYMFGWTFFYNFTLFKNNFFIANWHESTFARDKKDGYTKDGFQGSLMFFWKLQNGIAMGLQYRYAEQNLGYAGYQDGLIYTLRYYF